MGRVTGKVAFITGAARGQGRSHAVRLAQEGADIIAIDVCERIPENPYDPATEEDLAETVRQVEDTGSADRRAEGGRARLRAGARRCGRRRRRARTAGHRVRQRGISGRPNKSEDIPDDEWANMLDINLSGVWRAVKAAIPHMRSAGNGGSIILTSSDAGLFAYENISHYVSAKHGVIGLMRTLALELAHDMIRVNAICPTTVDTDMVQNDAIYRLFRPDLENPTKQDFADAAIQMNALPIPWVEAVDISNALLFLASDEARYITGVALPVDAGAAVK